MWREKQHGYRAEPVEEPVISVGVRCSADPEVLDVAQAEGLFDFDLA